MCGIAGYIPAPGVRPQLPVLRSMCRQLDHRGPDGHGEYLDSSIALGHRRLSIIDVQGGAQPLSNETGSLQVVFNGELYNFEDLRKDLRSRGHLFRTKSDTEVLVHLYEEVGERLPEYLNGMFAFAIWNRQDRTLFLSRDRFGEKPLYYTGALPGIGFSFASELKALAVLPGFDPRVRAESVLDFLSLSYVPDPHTIYENVHKLPPAHSLSVTANGRRLRRYWQLSRFAEDQVSAGEAAEQIRSVAAEAVKMRMISDVPLGAFLSGGIDSSAVVALMSKDTVCRPKTFSIGFTNANFDEREYARLVANRYRTDHQEQVVTPSIHETLDCLFAGFDEPFGDSSAVPMFSLARMTREQVTVALSGDGADEVFGGYRRYYFGDLEERLRAPFPRWFRSSVIRAAGEIYPKADYLPQMFRGKTLLTNLSADLANAYFTSMSTFRDAALECALSPELKATAGWYSPREQFTSRFRGLTHLPPLTQMQLVDIETYLPGDILTKVDRTTMMHSLESRAPWLDHRLAEISFRCPAHYHLQGSKRKHLFRESMASLIPERILSRSKMGFSVPLGEWFRTSLKQVFVDTVLTPAMEQYLSLSHVRKIWVEHQSGRHHHDRKLWNLLMLAGWDSRHRAKQTAFESSESEDLRTASVCEPAP